MTKKPIQKNKDIEGYTPREILLEQARRLSEEQYRYYEPSGKGEDFIDAFASGENFIVLYSAANGVGKTATCSNILAHLFWNTGENEYFNGELFKNFPFKKRGRIVSTPTNVEKNIIPEMKTWFPRGRYKTNKGNKKFESIWTTDTGWEFDIMTYEQDAMEFEGVTLGWAWFDEPPPQAILKATISRMRTGGIIIIGATPLGGSAYLYDAFAKGTVEIELTSQENGATMKYERKVGYVEADIESACKEHGVRGHLKHDHIMQMVAEYSEDEKQARIYGKFQHLAGLVFKQFTPRIHVIEPFDINPKDFCVYEFLDPHPRNPDAIMWVAVDKNNTKYVVDELFIKVNSESDLASRIKNKASQYRIIRRMADPSLWVNNQHNEDGKCLGDKLAELGLTYLPATKARAMADRRIESALKYVEINGYMQKAPELYIFSNCKRTIFEMEHYRWQEYTGKSADLHDPNPKPVDKDDHQIENLGRCLYNEPRFVPVTKFTPSSAPNLDPYA
jgi:phage terminase large subunit-like protein